MFEDVYLGIFFLLMELCEVNIKIVLVFVSKNGFFFLEKM